MIADILELLQVGSDAATIIIMVALWRFDRRLLIIELNPNLRQKED